MTWHSPTSSGDAAPPLSAGDRIRVLRQLFRAGNSALLGALAVFSAVTSERGLATAGDVVALFVSWTALAAAAYAVNDVVDRENDRVNRPDRYLQRLETCPRWIIRSIAAAGLAAFLSACVVRIENLLVLEAAWACFAVGYSFGLKRRAGLAANLLSAFCVAGSAAPGFLLGIAQPVLAFLPILFLVMLAREIWKDIEDEAGDARAGLRTLPLTTGRATAGRVASVIAGVGFMLLLRVDFPQPPLRVAAAILAMTGLALAVAMLVRPPQTGARGVQRAHRAIAVCILILFIGSALW